MPELFTKSEALAALVAAVIALPVGMLVELFRHRLDRRAKTPVLVASYLDTIADALLGMVGQFRGGQIPYKEGHLFDSLIDVFGEATREVLSAQQWGFLSSLQALARKAEDIDLMMQIQATEPKTIEAWTIDAERMAGELHGIAAKLRLRQA